MATTSPTDLVSLTRNGDVAELVLARADAHNAINRNWVDALAAATGHLAAATGHLAAGVLTDGVTEGGGGTGVRALLIRADGPAFTVGGDLAHFSAHQDDLVPELEGMIATFHAALATIAELPMPVVCAAHGSVAGGGLGLLWASDVVLLGAGTKLTTAFARLGLSGDGGSSWYLPRLVGERRALSLLLNATVLSADDALDMGLADAVVPADKLLAHARERARGLAAGPTLALATMRRLVREAGGRTLAEGLDAELAASARLGATEDVRRGIAAFSAGQRPEFHGT